MGWERMPMLCVHKNWRPSNIWWLVVSITKKLTWYHVLGRVNLAHLALSRGRHEAQWWSGGQHWHWADGRRKKISRRSELVGSLIGWRYHVALTDNIMEVLLELVVCLPVQKRLAACTCMLSMCYMHRSKTTLRFMLRTLPIAPYYCFALHISQSTMWTTEIAHAQHVCTALPRLRLRFWQ